MAVVVAAFFAFVLGNVQEALILDIGAGADADAVHIAAHYHAKPEGNILTQYRVANQGGIGGHPAAFAHLGLIVSVG